MSQRSFENRPPGLVAGRYLERLSKALPGRNWSRSSRDFWPDGGKLVISVSLHFESAQAEVPPLSTVADSSPGAASSPYGFREGIPRLLDLFRRRHVHVTTHMSRDAVEFSSHLAREIVERGHEAAAMASAPRAGTADDQRRSLEATIQTVQRATGMRPIGVKASCRSEVPRELAVLQELGLVYHSDDQSRDEPFLVGRGGAPFVVMPGSVITDDSAAYERRFFSSDQFASELKNQFEMLYSEAESRRRMMSVTIRDSVSGQPARSKVLEEFIIYAQRRPGVVFMRKDDIARFAVSSPITPRQEELRKGREAA